MFLSDPSFPLTPIEEAALHFTQFQASPGLGLKSLCRLALGNQL